jgi:hypothetical protein
MKKNRLFLLLAALLLLSLLPVPAVSSQAAFSASGGPLLGHEITVNSVDNGKHLPAVAYNANRREFLVVWHTTWAVGTRDIRAQRVSLTGKLLGSEITVAENMTHDIFQPSVAYDPVNDRYLVTYIYNTSSNPTNVNTDNTDLYGQLVAGNGILYGSAFSIITWPSQQWNPQVIYAPGLQKQFVMVWNNADTSGAVKAYVSLKHINPDGTFTGAGADLSYSDGSINYANPDITYNLARNEFVVVWEKVVSIANYDIMASRVQGSYVTMGGSPFMVAAWPDSEQLPSVAACNIADKYLVTWQSDIGSGGTDHAIYGYTLNGDASLDTVFRIDDNSGQVVQSDVACSKGGNWFLVTYADYWGLNGHYGITARKVFPNTSMDNSIRVVTGESTDRHFPAVVSGPTNFLVAWEHDRPSTSYIDIHAKLVSFYDLFLPANPR